MLDLHEQEIRAGAQAGAPRGTISGAAAPARAAGRDRGGWPARGRRPARQGLAWLLLPPTAEASVPGMTHRHPPQTARPAATIVYPAPPRSLRPAPCFRPGD